MRPSGGSCDGASGGQGAEVSSERVFEGARRKTVRACRLGRKDLDVADEPFLLLRMLGPFEVCHNGRAVPLKPQALRLLALLAVNADKSVSRTTIIEVIWDGEIPEVRNTDN